MIEKKIHIAVVLVTFNRLPYLKKALTYLQQQTYGIDKIYVINNASTDGTTEYLNHLHSDMIAVVNLTNNVGGAGGFSKGIKHACLDGHYDYYWVMDDDTYPQANALEKLLIATKKVEKNKPIGFLASNVRWGKDEVPAIMNVPVVSSVWNQSTKLGLVNIMSSSFVSMLISNQAVHECGLPISEFFIWGDDVEYSRRISQKFMGYFVADSIVIHATKANAGVDLLAENNPEKFSRYYYNFRNQAYIAREFGRKYRLKNSIKFWYLLGKIIFSGRPYRLQRIKVLIKGTWAGIFFRPQIKFPDSE
ncbi:glycosyltransferase family 2 protein [Fructilactobacillus florum]|uniref:glycosyltransferase family 2 protein n=1 Tax=Fructilactobacillus florum TaxID=640331 RepID=UPI0005905B9B|nr:glycosyltransferase family 2 protein [Fructilactobacillus florum]